MTIAVLKFVLETAGYSDVVTSSGSKETEDLVEAGVAEALILAVGNDTFDGLGLCTALRSRNYQRPIIFVSRRKDIQTKVTAFEHGADDYITEPFDPAELIARIRAAVWRFERVAEESHAGRVSVGDVELDPADLTFRVPGRAPVRLTPTEARMLACLMRNHGLTVNRQTLSERTWGFDEFAGNGRIDVCIRRLREKIEFDPAYPEHIQTIRGIGYTFVAEGRSKPDVFHDVLIGNAAASD
jgi:two-component system response regulator RegX3